MKKIIYGFSSIALMVFVLCAFSNIDSAKAANVAVSSSVQPYLNFAVTTGDTAAFGSLTPGSPLASPSSGTIASVTTNAVNGYTLGLSDDSDTNSALLHTDTTTYIADYAGTIGVPTTWSGTGLGVTLFAADTTKEAAWGTGTAYNDSNNKYAGISSTTTTAHTANGAHASVDTSTWAFKLDVSNAQKTGSYSGNVTFTATAVLS